MVRAATKLWDMYLNNVSYIFLPLTSLHLEYTSMLIDVVTMYMRDNTKITKTEMAGNSMSTLPFMTPLAVL
jgi:hypothetical protein